MEGKITLTAINIGARRATMVREHPTPNLRGNIAKENFKSKDGYHKKKSGLLSMDHQGTRLTHPSMSAAVIVVIV